MKNLFVGLPMFFSARLTDAPTWYATLIAFVAFCLVSSAVYCINDVVDVKYDRMHPIKKNRPVASGAIKRSTAISMACTLAILGLGLPSVLLGVNGVYTACVCGTYLIINLAYSLWLKRVAILDVALIALGFVLRVAAGALACDIWISPWIVCLTFLLTLMLALAKRRSEVALCVETGVESRGNISDYSLKFLDPALAMLAAITTVSYIIYTVTPEVQQRFSSEYVYITALFVILGLLRYLQLTLQTKQASDPTKLMLSDHFIQGCLLAWGATFLFIIYL
ncbi:MAG: UbiA prenyltransferase family protein [Firmicutes bacterium]|nr:UbiA prenyltransferase family protein [Bacillota bacterium]MCM1477213.1 UbiA prenyltransferase family protein [Bacteroides sp.]